MQKNIPKDTLSPARLQCIRPDSLLSALFCLVLFPASALAQKDLPLWELGAGIAALSLPAYRGADKTLNYTLPIPHAVYRGEYLKADRRGLRGEIFNDERTELTLSMSASPPVKSNDIAERANMPSLRPTIEIGPELAYTLQRDAGNVNYLKLRLPLRAAMSVENTPQNAGLLFSPSLNLDLDSPLGFSGWKQGWVFGPIFATRRQHAFFYNVAPAYATPTRPAYDAKGGYSGVQLLTSLSKRYQNAWVGAYLRYDDLRHATFVDSPLVSRKNYLTAGIAFTWVFRESETRVTLSDD